MKKTGILILVLVLALGALGVGYAAWSQNLTIHGTAQVATFNIAMYEDGTITNPAGSSVTATYGSLESYNQAGPASSSHGGGVTVAITDAVPGTYTIPLRIENLSSIPLNLTVGSIVADDVSGYPLPTGWTITQPFSTGVLAASGGSQSGDLEIIIPDNTAQGADFAFRYIIDAVP